MADQNQTTDGNRVPPANGAPSQPPSTPREGQTKPPGLMRLAGVEPSGRYYKSSEPVNIGWSKAKDRG